MKNTFGFLTALLASFATSLAAQPSQSINPADQIMPVVHCSDFEFTGDGDEPMWNSAGWTDLNAQTHSVNYLTRFKIMYSDSGIYCLF